MLIGRGTFGWQILGKTSANAMYLRPMIGTLACMNRYESLKLDCRAPLNFIKKKKKTKTTVMGMTNKMIDSPLE